MRSCDTPAAVAWRARLDCRSAGAAKPDGFSRPANWRDSVREDHPVDRFVAALEGDPTPSIVDAMLASAQRLAGRRNWVISPPRFLDQSDDSSARWVGFVLQLYTALPPWGNEIDPRWTVLIWKRSKSWSARSVASRTIGAPRFNLSTPTSSLAWWKLAEWTPALRKRSLASGSEPLTARKLLADHRR